MNTIYAPIRITSLQNNKQAIKSPPKKADIFYASQMTSDNSSKNVSFSGNPFNLIKTYKESSNFREAFKRASIEEFEAALKPMRNPKSILKILGDKPKLGGFDGPESNAEMIMRQPQKLKALAQKLKTLGVSDPLSEFLKRINTGSWGICFNKKFIEQFMNSLLTENKELISRNSITKHIKPIVDDMLKHSELIKLSENEKNALSGGLNRLMTEAEKAEK